ncbi:Uncharacterized protein HZ326_29557 [Fusarium oxysporum f. sp. albedinis]|nr:hypothetical protein HZ326_31295 [Fusarium oxysporum f. sp. albedinis]KAJ0127336.1 Uncharacterized protein HZ326_29557 [Fusarium oxysporum f. sp. albedinis]
MITQQCRHFKLIQAGQSTNVPLPETRWLMHTLRASRYTYLSGSIRAFNRTVRPLHELKCWPRNALGTIGKLATKNVPGQAFQLPCSTHLPVIPTYRSANKKIPHT